MRVPLSYTLNCTVYKFFLAVQTQFHPTLFLALCATLARICKLLGPTLPTFSLPRPSSPSPLPQDRFGYLPVDSASSSLSRKAQFLHLPLSPPDFAYVHLSLRLARSLKKRVGCTLSCMYFPQTFHSHT